MCHKCVNVTLLFYSYCRIVTTKIVTYLLLVCSTANSPSLFLFSIIKSSVTIGTNNTQTKLEELLKPDL